MAPATCQLRCINPKGLKIVYLHGSLTPCLSRAAFPPQMEIKRCLFAQTLKPGLPVTWVADLCTSCSSLRARLGHMEMSVDKETRIQVHLPESSFPYRNKGEVLEKIFNVAEKILGEWEGKSLAQ